MLPVRLANRTYAAAHALGLRLIPDAVTAAEGAALLASVARPLQRMRYAPAHFDNAIHGFRELRSRFAEHAEVVARLQQLAAPDATFSKEVHVLDLAATGQILPHLDSVKFVGPVIAGLSLLSPSVMRFEHEDDPTNMFEAFLPPHSLYVMSGDVRFKFKHSITDYEFEWQGVHYKRDRRVSMVMRIDTDLTRA